MCLSSFPMSSLFRQGGWTHNQDLCIKGWQAEASPCHYPTRLWIMLSMDSSL